eukprot:271361-Prorocentrum_minimum.AAC.1
MSHLKWKGALIIVASRQVLSVVAQQLQCILSAQRVYGQEFVFTDGEMLKLAPGAGVFATMNPGAGVRKPGAGGGVLNAGYHGRNNLPENLKVLFSKPPLDPL